MKVRRKKVKRCKWCGNTKPIAAFHHHAKMKDGRLNKCGECVRRYVRKRYREKRDQLRAYDRNRNLDPERRKKMTEYARKARAKNPAKYRARTAVSNALRDGRLFRKPCEVCGSLKVQAHHEDYLKPLVVRWLCKLHHDQEHGTVV